MAFTDYLLLAAGAGAVYYLLRPQKKAESTQELLDYVDISQEGIIELTGNKYRLVIEVEPINMALRSLQEQATIWLSFKNLINSLNLPTTFLIQTRYLNLKDYLDWLRSLNHGKPENIKKLTEEHIEYMQKKTEGKHLRDRRYFIILKIDAASAGVEGGIQIDNPILDTLVKSIPKTKSARISTEGMRQNAQTELFESASLIRGNLDAMGIHSAVLNKKAVLELLYQTFNRDMAPFARLEEVQAQNMLSLFMNSRTPETVLTNI
ncbi:MAG: hypothetical protein A4E53_00816 [Pelotomaculum sp. PtaB.Bin104]|nr:MAG: hypothetical protein A4E53_00816 [Pelotomaculum sp. PtaB.Bin104]